MILSKTTAFKGMDWCPSEIKEILALKFAIRDLSLRDSSKVSRLTNLFHFDNREVTNDKCDPLSNRALAFCS